LYQLFYEYIYGPDAHDHLFVLAMIVAAIYREVCLRVAARDGLTAHARNSERAGGCNWFK
jgi:hypothetical protein